MTYTPTPDDRHSIVIVKTMTYRGGVRSFSNRYHFEGDLPADHDVWQTFADNIVALEKLILPASCNIVEAVGYDKSSATLSNLHGDSVFSAIYTTVGTLAIASGASEAPGDCVALVRYSTPARSARNHPIYLFNYYHGAVQASGTLDALEATQKTAMETYAGHWVTGITDGSLARERCGPHGAVATGHSVDQWIRHRDFPS